MKLHFEPDLDYQHQAIEAICDLFRGQESCRTEFTVTRAPAGQQYVASLASTDVGTGNRLTLLDDALLANLNSVQLRNGLAPSKTLASGDFTVEMETGTGKTYVYLRTIFELNARYGFTKFVVVVPSIAIKEGVYKSLQMTEEHFRGLYANAPFDYFLYDSARLGQVRSFATSPHIQIMVVTVGAINKQDVNNLYKPSEKIGDEKPVDLIKATRPILIIDEPQSVDGGLKGQGKAALDAMSPLCTLRYSATHATKHHMVFRLDAVDAYERKLVKQIEVASATIQLAHNHPYVRLISTASQRGLISARVEVDVDGPGGVRRRELIVHDGDDLAGTTGRALYAGYRIGTITVGAGRQSMELRVPGTERYLRPGDTWGDVDAHTLQREMIRRTIKEHLEKEKQLRPKGIKVLSLFFIDAVDKYRTYGVDGTAEKGKYARMFEEEYRRWATHPDYQTLFDGLDIATAVETAHDGYFSIDRKGGWTDTSESNQTSRESAERAYNLIMREKEQLLSLETPLKFIFSHSALREGWDNPNIFQICSLREMQSERQRRQTIGRGLRLCVNQNGDRIRGFDVNRLTVIATERYEDFAANLQKEIEQDTGIRFGIVEPHQFALIPIADGFGGVVALGVERSQDLWDYLFVEGMIDASGRVQQTLRAALRDRTLSLPDAFLGLRAEILESLAKVAGRLEIRNADDRRSVRSRQAVLDSEEFRQLWTRIKAKTTYRVNFDNERLIAECVGAVSRAPRISPARLQWRKADVAIGRAGIEATEHDGGATVSLDEGRIELPDILTDLQERTQLTRRSLYRILNECGRLDDFQRNPQQFIELVAASINRCKRMALVDGIKYQRLGDDFYFAQELFQREELSGYLHNMLIETSKSVFEHVICESDIERDFADQMEKNDSVKVYAKLPGWFRVPTPLGNYTPDWAVLIRTEEGQRVYFVVETKGTLVREDLRDAEQAKIKCGQAHFRALRVEERSPVYMVARTLNDVLAEAEA